MNIGFAVELPFEAWVVIVAVAVAVAAVVAAVVVAVIAVVRAEGLFVETVEPWVVKK